MESYTIFIIASIALIVTPGPDIIYVLTRGIADGKRSGAISAVGVTSGILIHTMAAALGLAVLLQTSTYAFWTLKIAGGMQDFKDQERLGSVSFNEFGLASLYLEIVKGTMPVSLLTILKNIGFICKNVPFAAKKAELHLKNSIKKSESIGAMGIVGQTYLGLGILHQLKKRNELAHKNFSNALQIFKKTGAYKFQKQAEESLDLLEQ